MKFCYQLVGLFVLLSLTGCATPTISDTLQIRHISASSAESTAGPVTLIGGSAADWSRAINCDAQGACTLFGYTIKSFGESTDYSVVHLNPEGAPQWARTYGGTNKDKLQGAIVTSDGGALLYGASRSLFYTPLKVFSPHRPPRPFIIKIDREGKLQWARLLELGALESRGEIEQAVQTPDGGYALVGSYWESPSTTGEKQNTWNQWLVNGKQPSSPLEAEDVLVLKLDANGKAVWLHRYALAGKSSTGWAIANGLNGHLLIGGVEQEGAYYPLWLEIDASGKVLHAETLETPARAVPVFALPLAKGGAILGGTLAWNTPSPEVFAIWLARDGDPTIAKHYSAAIGFKTMGAVMGHGKKLCISGRSALSDNGRIASGLGLLLGSTGEVVSTYEIRGQGRTEFSAAGTLPDGRYRLFGDTEAFGASYFDTLTAVWQPTGKGSLKISAQMFTTVAHAANVSVVTGSLDTVHKVPVSDVGVRVLQIGPEAAPDAN